MQLPQFHFVLLLILPMIAASGFGDDNQRDEFAVSADFSQQRFAAPIHRPGFLLGHCLPWSQFRDAGELEQFLSSLGLIRSTPPGL